jgi:hypothetical protein
MGHGEESNLFPIPNFLFPKLKHERIQFEQTLPKQLDRT